MVIYVTLCACGNTRTEKQPPKKSTKCKKCGRQIADIEEFEGTKEEFFSITGDELG